MIPEHVLLKYTDAAGVRHRQRIERSGDAWELLEERYDVDADEWVGEGGERVSAPWIEAELHGEFGCRDRDGVVDGSLEGTTDVNRGP
ncbi:hypothetical protein Hbl1158_10265 [Halobaculum sp. CBA1158]|uniref:hypothetical protein n=1 Tax=Halobaculum sp. CBA1158 TaxID=2904243 RepID=UPI001F207033|nr:hypothetical protein [Halobaculum sp. CBA1158]UIO98918.1 hypothetical protein Hbl1158_10265 [Halobaculum sp. CBA1158]